MNATIQAATKYAGASLFARMAIRTTETAAGKCRRCGRVVKPELLTSDGICPQCAVDDLFGAA